MGKNFITVKLTRAEVNALIDVGNRGVADLHDSGDDDHLEQADIADAVLTENGAICPESWLTTPEPPTCTE